jgi:hypothetical protein
MAELQDEVAKVIATGNLKELYPLYNSMKLQFPELLTIDEQLNEGIYIKFNIKQYIHDINITLREKNEEVIISKVAWGIYDYLHEIESREALLRNALFIANAKKKTVGLRETY